MAKIEFLGGLHDGRVADEMESISLASEGKLEYFDDPYATDLVSRKLKQVKHTYKLKPVKGQMKAVYQGSTTIEIRREDLS